MRDGYHVYSALFVHAYLTKVYIMKIEHKLILQYFLPQHAVSRFAGWVANCRISWFKNWLIKKFIARYKVDMSIAVETDPEKYACFNSFFTRALKPEARSVAAEPRAVISPVDGHISQIGRIDDDMLIQAKGKQYTLEKLLAFPDLADLFRNGSFATIYLSPKDYHRVHIPLTGQLRQMVYVPGTLFSVNKVAVNGVPRLFGRNERVITIFDTIVGPMAVIMVGAMVVGSVSTSWSGVVMPNRDLDCAPYIRCNGTVNDGRNCIKVWHSFKDHESGVGLVLQRGDELGSFQLGSTVIVLFARGMVRWLHDFGLNTPVKMGEEIGRVV